MKRQKPSMFLEKSLKINMLNIKNIVELEIISIIPVNIDVMLIAYAVESIAYISIAYFGNFSQRIKLWLSFYYKKSEQKKFRR